MNIFISKLIKLLSCVRYFYLTFKINKLRRCVSDSDECVILGNGPSLKESFEKDMRFIKTKKIFCVNRFAESEYYAKLKPSFYLIADSNYWAKEIQAICSDIKKNNISKYDKKTIIYCQTLMEINENTSKNIISKTQWKLNLCVPLHSKPSRIFDQFVKENKNINLIYYSAIPIDFNITFLRHLCYKFNLGMPTPQTVVIPAIFLALKSNFKKIFLMGVDHSWHEDLVLDENNILCTKDKHFYDTNIEEQKKIPLVSDMKTGRTTTMAEQFYALYLAFRSHVLLEEYSKAVGSKIFNFSKHSWVDAYEKYQTK